MASISASSALQIVLDLSADLVFGAEQDRVFVVGSHQTLDLARDLDQRLLVDREVAQLWCHTAATAQSLPTSSRATYMCVR